MLMVRYYAHGQVLWSKCYNWTDGFPISTSVNLDPIPQAPGEYNLEACAGQTIYFSPRFCDVDEGYCQYAPLVNASLNSSDYTVSITSSSNDATFPMGMTTIPEMQLALIELWDNSYPDGQLFVQVRAYSTIPLTISSSWNGTPFTVTITIKDEGVSGLPLCNTGNPIDQDLVLTYTISSSTISPTNLKKHNHQYTENQWNLSSDPQGEFRFKYKGRPNASPAYQGQLITESFALPSPGGMWDMSDLTQQWKNQNSAITTKEEAAVVLFSKGDPFSFTFDQQNIFEDTHRGFALMDPSQLNTIFTQNAINNKKVGYLLNQTYTVCSGAAWTTEVYRRMDYSTNQMELKKKHNF